MVNPRNRVSMSCESSVSTIRPPVAGTRLTHTRTFIPPRSALDALVLRVEQRRAPRDGDGHGVVLAEVLDRELPSDRCVLRGEIGQEDVLADRGPRSRAGHVGAAALGVGQRAAVAGE